MRSLVGLLYLVFLGSLVAFTAYIWLLQRFSATLVATHTYVNPIVAVLLGWALAGESVTLQSLLAGAAVVVAIVLVGKDPHGHRPAIQQSQQQTAVPSPAQKMA